MKPCGQYFAISHSFNIFSIKVRRCNLKIYFLVYWQERKKITFEKKSLYATAYLPFENSDNEAI